MKPSRTCTCSILLALVFADLACSYENDETNAPEMTAGGRKAANVTKYVAGGSADSTPQTTIATTLGGSSGSETLTGGTSGTSSSLSEVSAIGGETSLGGTSSQASEPQGGTTSIDTAQQIGGSGSVSVGGTTFVQTSAASGGTSPSLSSGTDGGTSASLGGTTSTVNTEGLGGTSTADTTTALGGASTADTTTALGGSFSSGTTSSSADATTATSLTKAEFCSRYCTKLGDVAEAQECTVNGSNPPPCEEDCSKKYSDFMCGAAALDAMVCLESYSNDNGTAFRCEDREPLGVYIPADDQDNRCVVYLSAITSSC